MLSTLTQTTSEISEQAQVFLDDYYKSKGVGENPELRLGFLRDELNQHVSAGLSDEQELAALEYHLLVEMGLVDPEVTQEPFPEKAQAVLDALYKAVGARDESEHLEYWRKQMQGFVSANSDEEELRMREFYFLTQIGALED